MLKNALCNKPNFEAASVLTLGTKLLQQVCASTKGGRLPSSDRYCFSA